jgi:hypothetical protein
MASACARIECGRRGCGESGIIRETAGSYKMEPKPNGNKPSQVLDYKV